MLETELNNRKQFALFPQLQR